MHRRKRHISTFFFIGYTNKTVLRCTIWKRKPELCGAVGRRRRRARLFAREPYPPVRQISPAGRAPVGSERRSHHRSERGAAAHMSRGARGRACASSGQLRSFNNKSGQGSKLVITVFAQSIEPGDGTYFNRILLSGALCKKPVSAENAVGAQHLRPHPGREPPLRAGGLSAVHRLGADCRCRSQSMDVGDRLTHRGARAEPHLHQAARDRQRGAHGLRSLRDAARGGDRGPEC